jgi:hypothetical protein
LVKEYRRLIRIPPPGIEAHPLDENILEFHFVLRCDQPPYKGGKQRTGRRGGVFSSAFSRFDMKNDLVLPRQALDKHCRDGKSTQELK